MSETSRSPFFGFAPTYEIGGASSGWLQGGGFPEDQGALGDGGSDDNVVFLDPSLHLRRYNSVSLAEDGVYRITLSDCHGFVVAPPVASAAVGSGAKHPNGGGERGVETARLLFFSLPPYLDFEVDSQVCVQHIVTGCGECFIGRRIGRISLAGTVV